MNSQDAEPPASDDRRALDLVSVVIPTRNRSYLLARAVTSALSQTHRSIEVIVVDDASEDDTPDLLSILGEEDSRLRVFRNQIPRGAARARNIGAREARGDLLAFLDDDCRWSPWKIARQLRELDEEHGAVVCRQRLRDVTGDWYVEGGTGTGARPMESLLGFGTNTLLVRKDLFVSLGGFDEELPRLQDWELLLRLSHRTRVACVPEALVQGIMVDGGITLTKGPLIAAAERIVAHHDSRLDAGDRALLRYILGKFLLVDGHAELARKFMRQAIKNDPRVPRYWAGALATFLGPGPARWVRSLHRAASRRHNRGTSEETQWDRSQNPRRP